MFLKCYIYALYKIITGILKYPNKSQNKKKYLINNLKINRIKYE